MTLADLISCAERLKRQSWRLYVAKPGDDVVGYWGGSRSDLSNAKHIFSFDFKLLSEIGLKPRHLNAVLKQPFALAEVTRGDNYPEGEIVPVPSGTLADSSLKVESPWRQSRFLHYRPWMHYSFTATH